VREICVVGSGENRPNVDYASFGNPGWDDLPNVQNCKRFKFFFGLVYPIWQKTVFWEIWWRAFYFFEVISRDTINQTVDLLFTFALVSIKEQLTDTHTQW